MWPARGNGGICSSSAPGPSEAREQQLAQQPVGAQGTAVAGFTLEPEGEGTKVTWGFEADLGYNPVTRYMGLMFDSWIGADYEAGLASLKALVEGQG